MTSSTLPAQTAVALEVLPGLDEPLVGLGMFDDVGAADAAVTAIRAAARERAVAEAALAAAIVTLADLGEDREHDSLEVAAVLRWTPRFADDEVFWCRVVRDHLPEVWDRWQAGVLDRHRARVFHECLVILLPRQTEAAQRIAGLVLAKAHTMTAAQLRRRLNALVFRHDPADKKKQVEQTIADRDVYLGNGGDGGTAQLTAYHLPVARAAAAFERVDAIARARRAGGDARTLAQLRADTVLDLLDGTGCEVGPQFRQGVLDLQIPLATAIGADAMPGDLAGYGPVLADIARQIAVDRSDQQWRFSVTYKGELVYQGITKARPEPHPGSNTGSSTGIGDSGAATPDQSMPDRGDGRDFTAPGSDRGAVPGTQATAGTASQSTSGGAPAGRFFDYLTGQPITGVDTHVPCPPVETDPQRRFPGRKLRMWITARDRTCQAPGCNAPARICQYDHTCDYADGGCTCDDNLALLCERHHKEKHNGWWRVYQVRPGVLIWVTPHGHIYRQLCQ